jgi:hypothetical protein
VEIESGVTGRIVPSAAPEYRHPRRDCRAHERSRTWRPRKGTDDSRSAIRSATAKSSARWLRPRPPLGDLIDPPRHQGRGGLKLVTSIRGGAANTAVRLTRAAIAGAVQCIMRHYNVIPSGRKHRRAPHARGRLEPTPAPQGAGVTRCARVARTRSTTAHPGLAQRGASGSASDEAARMADQCAGGDDAGEVGAGATSGPSTRTAAPLDEQVAGEFRAAGDER